MIFRQLFDAATCTYTYLLADADSKEALLIDPVLEQVERDIKLVEELGLTLLYSVETHVHADHITGSGRLRQATGCQVALSVHAGVDCADIELQHGDVLRFGRHQLQVLETPGHTNSCLSFVSEGRVFTGDALMVRACGRTDFQQGNASRLYDSIVSVLYELPDETLVYPGHDYKGMTVSSIAEEKRYNPRVSLGREGFIDVMDKLNLPEPKRIREAVPANQQCGMAVS